MHIFLIGKPEGEKVKCKT